MHDVVKPTHQARPVTIPDIKGVLTSGVAGPMRDEGFIMKPIDRTCPGTIKGAVTDNGAQERGPGEVDEVEPSPAGG
jgi:hypothetical protein